MRLRFVASLALLAGLSLTACAPGEQPAPPLDSNAAQPAVAEIDPASGTIMLPWDRYVLTPREHDDIVSAQGVAMIACVEAAGISSAETPKRVIPDNDSSRRYGVWLMRDAELHGYILPESKEKTNAITNQGNASVFSQAELTQREKCVQSSDTIKSLDMRALEAGGPWVVELDGAGISARKSQEWQRALGDWEACLDKAGIRADMARMSAAGVNWAAVDEYEVREEDVQLAVADVRCKDTTNLVQRLADIDARAQQPIISKYRAELEKSHDDLLALHDRALKVLSDAGL